MLVLLHLFLPGIIAFLLFYLGSFLYKHIKKMPRFSEFLFSVFKIGVFCIVIFSLKTVIESKIPNYKIVFLTMLGLGIYILFKASKDEREFIIRFNLSRQIFIKSYNNTSFTEQFSYLQDTLKSNPAYVTMLAVNNLYEETVKKEVVSEKYKDFDEVYNQFVNLETPTEKLDFVWDLPAEYYQKILKESLFEEIRKKDN